MTVIFHLVDGSEIDIHMDSEPIPSTLGSYYYFRLVMPNRVIDIPTTSITHIEKLY